ncbi:MAG: hypothetical protein KIT80_20250 [Chitinophagaceae bacterium]|nr:hypothetical protein [Chitinophagaceae bacterium]MCW5929263.1 hypothetical protein [Chitinophagaceae bacterium]
MKGLLLLILILSGSTLQAQNLTGQWRGSFNSAGNSIVAGEGDTEYVLELEINGPKVSGYSYSYFNYYPKNYYVICRLEGTYEKESKSIVVNEEERIKGNTPPGWSDCLQTHILTFLKQGKSEKLVGRWRGYRPSDCGFGSTELERKMLTKVAPPRANPPVAKTTTPAQKPSALQQKPDNKSGTTTSPPVKKPAASPGNAAAKKPVTKPAEKPETKAKISQVPERIKTDTARKKLPDIVAPSMQPYGKRDKKVLKTIEVPNYEEFRVDFYDNGEIDGDTITVYFNNKMILSRQRLTDKPLTIKVKLDPNLEDNELIMYADNLGAIPPNTALMVATIGGKRHEVYISSTEKTSGTIRFRKKED